MADRFDELLIEMRSQHDESMARWDQRTEQTDDLIRFVGELNRRGEIALQNLLRSTAAMRAEIRASIEMTKATLESARATLENCKTTAETTKAHTRAIFALIDRLEGGGPLRPAT